MGAINPWMTRRKTLRPKANFIAAIAGTLSVLGGCATHPDPPLKDRFGLISITMPLGWEDATSTYIYRQDAAQSFGRLRNDSGIRQLLFVKREKLAECKFRELTYMPGETGYAWDLETLNQAVANTRNSYMNTTAIEFARLGIIPTALNTKANSTELKLSEATKFNGYEAWQHRYRHVFNGDRAGRVSAETWTISMRFASKGAATRRYLVAECSLEGSLKYDQQAAASTEKLLAGIDFDGDIRTGP